jgi:pantoate--beta-alanine ligase
VNRVITRAELTSAMAIGPSDACVGFIPTMGALHAGHCELIACANRECDLVVVSVFVNPTQFDDAADLATYPRDPEADAVMAENAGCDIFWTPNVEDLYPNGLEATVRVSDELTSVLCGAEGSRGPEHFAGVTTVVSRLFDAVSPDIAYFGEKDAQQLAVIKRMVIDLGLPIEIRGVPTVRDPDGLAMSSRNQRLTPDAREVALGIPRALSAAEEMAEQGETSTDRIRERVRQSLTENGIEAEYVETRNPEDLSCVEMLNGHPVLLAVAATVGEVRLIDNVILEGRN